MREYWLLNLLGVLLPVPFYLHDKFANHWEAAGVGALMLALNVRLLRLSKEQPPLHKYVSMDQVLVFIWAALTLGQFLAGCVS